MASTSSWAALVSKTRPTAEPDSGNSNQKTSSRTSAGTKAIASAPPASQFYAGTSTVPQEQRKTSSTKISIGERRTHLSPPTRPAPGRPRSKTESVLGDVVSIKAEASRRRLASLSPHSLVPQLAPLVPSIDALGASATLTAPAERSSLAELSATQIRRTLSAHGKSLFVGSYDLPEGRNPEQENKGANVGISDEDMGATIVQDDGWNTVPTKRQKAKVRKERQERRRALGLNDETNSRPDTSDAGDHDSIVDYAYDEIASSGRHQRGSARKTQQFKAVQKRDYAKQKRAAQRSRS